MIATRRLGNQALTGPGFRRPANVVGWFGAMQAQEYEHAKWAIGLRLQAAGGETVERAFDAGRILRTHVLRPTWHFVTPEDIRWLLALTGPRVLRSIAHYYRYLELDARTVTRGVGLLERALGGGHFLTRRELAVRLDRAGLPLTNPQLAALMLHAELDAVVCSGPRRDGKFTYALLAERAAAAPRVSSDEALARLCLRYFRSHGPATVRDFVWWSGLTSADTARGLDMIGARSDTIEGTTYWSAGRQRRAGERNHLAHLLPIYDEYFVAYRDRTAVPHGPVRPGSAPVRSVIFQHTLVIRGDVAGTWRLSGEAARRTVRVTPLRRLTRLERRAIRLAGERYARFLGGAVEFVIG